MYIRWKQRRFRCASIHTKAISIVTKVLINNNHNQITMFLDP